MTAPIVLCRECGHSRVDHSIDLEVCRVLRIVEEDGRPVALECECRGWIGEFLSEIRERGGT